MDSFFSRVSHLNGPNAYCTIQMLLQIRFHKLSQCFPTCALHPPVDARGIAEGLPMFVCLFFFTLKQVARIILTRYTYLKMVSNCYYTKCKFKRMIDMVQMETH